jgi:hypothetical protein
MNKKKLKIALIVVLIPVCIVILNTVMLEMLKFLSHHIGIHEAFVLVSFGMALIAFVLIWITLKKKS